MTRDAAVVPALFRHHPFALWTLSSQFTLQVGFLKAAGIKRCSLPSPPTQSHARHNGIWLSYQPMLLLEKQTGCLDRRERQL